MSSPLSAPGLPLPPPMPETPPRTSPLLKDLADFPDRLSPMIVKELRQGMRNRVFIIAFLALHVVLAFHLLYAIGDENSNPATFWVWTGLVLAWLLPARNLSAVSEEVKQRTIETLVLTRLSAWRIVLGKWASTSSQILLLAISLTPYLVMRYLVMGVNPVSEFSSLFRLTLAGLTLTAVITGLSGMGSWVTRLILVIVGGMLLMRGVMAFVTDLGGSPGSFFAATLGLMIPAVWISIMALDGGAAQIAPASENHSSMRRALTLAVMLACLFWNGAGEWRTLMLHSALFLGICLGLTDAPNHLPVIQAPFVRRGILGRLAAVILLPGPASGVVYTGLICLLWLLGVGGFGSGLWLSRFVPDASAAWGIVASLLLPAVILRMARPTLRWSGPAYVGLTVILTLLGTLALGASYSSSGSSLGLFSILTPAGWIGSYRGAYGMGIGVGPVVPLMLAAIWYLILVITVLPEFSRAREMRKLVEDNIKLV